MRKLLLALTLGLGSLTTAQAAAGDTTWVQAQNNIQLDHYGAYDLPVTFPNGSATYRKIYMEFTMGTYTCPSGSQYCHQWDYDIHNIIMNASGDTLEIGRFISPYANTGVPRFPANWTHRYIWDVTDYYPLLKNSATFRIFYSGYSWGFTGNVRFAFVEGTPPRNVTGISKLWSGSWQYGNSSDPIDNHVTAKTQTPPTGTQSGELKFLVTGHGSDNNGCCEFMSHNYQVKLNSTAIDNNAIWRADCGANQVYPQGGTWIYERANWCPGALVNGYNHPLGTLSSSTPYTLDVDFDSYTGGGTLGQYSVVGAVVYYGGFNHTRDASLEDIIAPTDFEGYFRNNPSDGYAWVKVRNTGSSNIDSVRFRYGIKDSAFNDYVWTGRLLPLQDTLIRLPELSALKNLSMSGASGKFNFQARIMNVNGSADQDTHNDTLGSWFTVAPTWPNAFTIYFKTNSEGQGGVGVGPSETSWSITDMNGTVIASRVNADINATYLDTVSLPHTGFYKLTVTDGSCDGLHWWVWDQNPGQGINAGFIQVRKLDDGSGLPLGIPVKGNTYSGGYHDDFGCGFVQNFTAPGRPAAVKGAAKANAQMLIIPNPTTSEAKISLYGLNQVSGTITIVDAVGRICLQTEMKGASMQIDTRVLNAGIYQVRFSDKQGNLATQRMSVMH
jgi:hypothetical protein